MGLVWFLISFFLLATSSFAEDEQGRNNSALHFTLYHVLGHGSPLTSQSPPSISELVYRDQARVKYLNSRLTEINRKSSVTEHLFGSNFISTPVNSDMSIGVGIYYVNIGLGTPTSYYPVVVDTGSSLSWLQCLPCTWPGCHEQAVPIFDPSASSTYKRLSCTTPECNSLKEGRQYEECTSNKCMYKIIYGDNSSSSGYLSQDSLSLTPLETLADFVFGCGQNNTGSFRRSAGIFGLGHTKLSMVSQLSPKYGNAFSYCLPTASGGNGGLLSIGWDSLMGSPYKFTPMLRVHRKSGFYFLKLSAIVVAGKTLQGVSDAEYSIPTILDSGTTLTYLHPSVYAALRDEFTKIMSSKHHQTIPTFNSLDACYMGSLKEMSSDVPEVQMVFQGEAELTLAPQNILIESLGITCLAFGAKNSFAVIGNVQQQTYRVAYDVSGSRIGFAAGGCS
ncbi:aspartyl protease family protein At5g10770-like [Cornus florida]|uniref:aspartyl protease family protein At5g10770-like n=1 Tax=Cornus florida TaxID=4283 RepID=UPI00289A4A7B|nr:aspartyl protease family protein At5g10770-like [Cornus florida]